MSDNKTIRQWCRNSEMKEKKVCDEEESDKSPIVSDLLKAFNKSCPG
jgi:hypothetical protein